MINYFKGSLNTYAIIHQCEAASTNVHEFPERIYNLANTVHFECVTARTDLQETICLMMIAYCGISSPYGSVRLG